MKKNYNTQNVHKVISVCVITKLLREFYYNSETITFYPHYSNYFGFDHTLRLICIIINTSVLIIKIIIFKGNGFVR